MIQKISIFFLIFTIFNSYSQEEVEISISNKKEQIYSNFKVDVPSNYKGSNDSIFAFFKKHSNLKISNIKIDEQSTYFNILIDEKGCPYKVEIIKSLGKEYDKEVNKIISEMSFWTPAIHNGKKVKVSVIEYITFK